MDSFFAFNELSLQYPADWCDARRFDARFEPARVAPLRLALRVGLTHLSLYLSAGYCTC